MPNVRSRSASGDLPARSCIIRVKLHPSFRRPHPHKRDSVPGDFCRVGSLPFANIALPPDVANPILTLDTKLLPRGRHLARLLQQVEQATAREPSSNGLARRSVSSSITTGLACLPRAS